MLAILTLILSFLSLLGVIQIAELFNVTPAQLHDPTQVLNGSTILLALTIFLAPIAIAGLMQKFIHRESIKELGFNSTKARFFWGALGIGALGKLLATAVSFLVSPAARIGQAIPEHKLASFLPYFAWFLIALFLNSLSEEFVYRAYAIEHLKRRLGGIAAIITSAAIFSLMHFIIEPFDTQRLLYRMAFGLAAGLLYLRQDSIWGAIGLHTGWNFVALSCSDTDWRLGGIVSVTGLNHELLANSLVLATLAAIFFKKPQRLNQAP